MACWLWETKPASPLPLLTRMLGEIGVRGRDSIDPEPLDELEEELLLLLLEPLWLLFLGEVAGVRMPRFTKQEVLLEFVVARMELERFKRFSSVVVVNSLTIFGPDNTLLFFPLIVIKP